MKRKYLKKTLFALCMVIFLGTFVSMVLLFCGPRFKDWQNVLTIISAAFGIFALPFTIYSTYVVWIELRNGTTCSKRKLRCHAKKLSGIINAFTPDYIIYVAGNCSKLYEDYLKFQINPYTNPVALPAILRYYNPPTKKHMLLSKKFYIVSDLIQNLELHGNERIVILDDISKTGDTIKTIKQYLIKKCSVSSANILTCSFVVDKYGYPSSAEPSFYCLRTEVKDDFRFPWRQA